MWPRFTPLEVSLLAPLETFSFGSPTGLAGQTLSILLLTGFRVKNKALCLASLFLNVNQHFLMNLRLEEESIKS